MAGVIIAPVPEFGWCETCDGGQHWQCYITPILGGHKAELVLSFDELPEKQQRYAWPRLHTAPKIVSIK